MTYVAGTKEYLSVEISCSVTLDTQDVDISIDGEDSWIPCTWVGSAGTTRKARTVSPITLVSDGSQSSYTVLVRVTDEAEIPIMFAGTFTVTAPDALG